MGKVPETSECRDPRVPRKRVFKIVFNEAMKCAPFPEFFSAHVPESRMLCSGVVNA